MKLDKTSLNPGEIGSFPQADGINHKIKFNIGEIEEREAPLYGLLLPPEPIMNKKAKFTTLLSVAAINDTRYLVLTISFIEFLKTFTTGGFETWPLRVHHKNGISEEYELFRLIMSSDKKYVNFKASTFSIGEISAIYDSSTKRTPVYINGYNEYRDYKEKLYNTGEMMLYDDLIVDLTNCQEDILKFSYTIEGYVVSERLKHAIEEKGFTGMAFKEISEVDQRIKVIY